MAAAVRTVNLKAGLPTVEQAREKLKVELTKVQRLSPVVLKLIHGYGSSGVGGAIRTGIRRSLRKRLKEGKIRAFVPGEQWDIFDASTQQILAECPALANDRDLNSYNEGVTIVLI